MRVSEVMTDGVRTVPSSMSAVEAHELMRVEGIRHLVVKDGSAVVGVLSERDAGGRKGASVRATRSVADLMTHHVATIDAGATIRQAANLMRGRTIGCLPVMKGRRLVGILTVSDLLVVIAGGIDRPARPARQTARHRGTHRGKKSATGVW